MAALRKRIIASVLCLAMVLCLFPHSVAFAEDGDEELFDEYAQDGEALLERSKEFNYTGEDVLYEIESRREEYEKHFQLSDGTSLAVSYGEQVHWLNSDGEYEVIDPSLKLFEPDGTESGKPAEYYFDQAEKAGEQTAEELRVEAPEPDETQTESVEEETGPDTAEAEPGENEDRESTELLEESEEGEGQEAEDAPSDEENPDAAGEESSEAAEEQAEESTDEPTDPVHNEDIDETVEEPAEEGADEEPSEEPADEPTDEPADEPADEPTDEPADEPTDEPADEPADEPTDEPADEPTDEPSDEKPEEDGFTLLLNAIGEWLSNPPELIDPRVYRNGSGPLSVSMAAQGTAGELVRLSYGDHSISMTPFDPAADAKGLKPAELVKAEDVFTEGTFEYAISPHHGASSLLYRDYYQSTDLRYDLGTASLKESIILREPAEEYRYVFVLDCGGLKPLLTEGGELELRDTDGDVVFLLPAGTMIDAEGIMSTLVKYELSEGPEGRTVLTVTADADWINAEERVWPVTVDPTIIVNGASNMEYISIKNASYSGYSTNMLLGLFDGTTKYRTLLRVKNLPTIPTKCQLVNARIGVCPLNVLYWQDHGPLRAYLSEMTTYPWSNGVGKSSTLLDYVDIVKPAEAAYYYEIFDIAIQGYKWYGDITPTVLKWYANSSTNKGICFYPQDEAELNAGYGAQCGFYLNDNSNAGPRLLVQYRNLNGLENYLTRQTHSIDRAGTGYIGDYNGQLTLVKTDVAMAGTSNPVTIEHVYNSAYSGGDYGEILDNTAFQYMKLGKGWKLNLMQTVSYDAANSTLNYVDGDGTVHYFSRSGDVYKDEDGLGLSITALGGSAYDLTDRYGNVMHFEHCGLRSITDANGNRYNLLFESDRITSVTRTSINDTTETVATLTWENNYLTSIIDSAGIITYYTYSNGMLTGIEHADQSSVSYTYNSNAKMTQAKDNESGYSVIYDYDAKGLIYKFYEYVGGVTGTKIEVFRSFGETVYQSNGLDRTIHTGDDLRSRYVFDYYGRTITQSLSNADDSLIYGTQSNVYSSNQGQALTNNRLALSGSTQIRPVGIPAGAGIVFCEDEYHQTTENLLQNGEMAVSGYWSGGTYVNDSSFGRAIKVTGEPYTTKTVSQTAVFVLPDQSGYSYLLSAWAKADSLALNSSRRKFEMQATLNYASGQSETFTGSFNAQSKEWQYCTIPIVPGLSGAINGVTVRFVYASNANDAYFTYACFTRCYAEKYDYNDNGELTSVESPQHGTTSYSYSNADLTQQVTPGSGTTTYTYDNRHNLMSSVNNGLTTSYTRDGMGNVTGTTLSGGDLSITTQSAYDSTGNLLTAQTDALGKTVTYSYAAAINRKTGQPSQVTDALGTQVNSTYDTSNGRLTGTELANTVSLEYTYTGGRINTVQRSGYVPGDQTAITQTYDMDYDAWGNLSAVKVGTNTLAAYSYFSGNGPLQQMTYGNGAQRSYEYDDLERLERVYYNNNSSPDLVYSYFGNGQLKKLTVPADGLTYEFAYDLLGRTRWISEKKANVLMISSEQFYDSADRLGSLSYYVRPFWTTGNQLGRNYLYSYNTDGTLHTMTGPSASFEYTYDALRRLKERKTKLENDTTLLKKEYTYVDNDSGGTTSTRIADLTNKLGNNSELHSYGYSYYDNGNIDKIIETDSNNSSITREYVYDAQGQLLSETMTGPVSNTLSCTYDSYGNIRTVTRNGSTRYYKYDNICDNTVVWADLLTEYDSNPITYDAIGNPTIWYDGAAMTWANGRELVSIVRHPNTVDETTISYTYRYDGLRSSKTDGSSGETHKYVWLDGKLRSESWGTNVLEFFYDESGAPYAFNYNGTAYYYVTNLQGDVVEIIDASGTVQASYVYDAWGVILSATGSLASINPLRYRGYYYDSETGFYYLKSRYYDPELGRFINADGQASTGQGFIGTNMFAYCLNNPVNGCDQSGMRMVYNVNADDGGGNKDYIIFEYSFCSTIPIGMGVPGSITVSGNGRLFIFKKSKYFPEDFDKPSDFVEGQDFLVGNLINRKNPNIQIYNSYKCTLLPQIEAITDALLNYGSSYAPTWHRTKESLIIEWEIHNYYSLFSDRAKHVDFDNDEEGKGNLYFFGKAVKSFWGA